MAKKKRKKPGKKLLSILCGISLFLLGVCGVYELLLPKQENEVDAFENRILAEKPVFSLASYFNGTYAENLENYLLDHFPLRQGGITFAQSLRQTLSLASWEDYARIADATEDITMQNGEESELFDPEMLPSIAPTTIPTQTPNPTQSPEAEPALSESTSPAPATATPRPHKPEVNEDDYPRDLGMYTRSDGKERVVKRFARSDVKKVCTLFDRYASLLPDDGNLVLTFVPHSSAATRLLAQDNPEAMYSDLETFIEAVTCDKVYGVSTMDTLSPLLLEGKNVFFRSDMHWTPEGAYYVYAKMVEKAGKTATPLESFHVEKEYPFLGTIYRDKPTKQMKDNPDTLELFTPPNQVRMMRVTKDGETELPLLDMNANARDRYTVYLGGPGGPWTILYSDAPTEENCLVITDSYGLCFVPLLTGQYKQVHYYDARYYKQSDLGKSVSEMIAEYGIKDIYLVLGVAHTFEDTYFAYCSRHL